MKNPFGFLKVTRDEEDEEEISSIQTTKNPILEGPLAEQHKKKKIRPEDKKILEEAKGALSKKMNEEEGFTEIRKSKKFETPDQPFEEKNFKEYKREHNHTINPALRKGKRLYDRHSGTGRGREVAKNGAGGKTTWGDADQIAKTEAIKYIDNYNNDENYFISAFKEPESQAERDVSTELKYTIEGEERKLEESKRRDLDYTRLDSEYTTGGKYILGRLGSKKEEKRRKKSLRADEMQKDAAKELTLEVTENSITYSEYLEQLKKKQENITNKTKISKQTLDGNQLPLESMPRKDTQEYKEWISIMHNRKKKPKEKKPDTAEDELNRMIGQKLNINTESKEPAARVEYNPSYQRRQYEYNYPPSNYARPTKPPQPVTFGKEDFPEL